MKYVIDGYNLFFRLESEINPLEQKRENFIEALGDALSRLDLHATLIFDGGKTHTAFYPSSRPLLSLEIIFSPGNVTADDYILERLSTEKHPQTQMIVTSDRELTRKAKDLGAKTLTIEAFFKLLTKKEAKNHGEKKQEVETTREFNRLLETFEKKLKDD